ncbi:AraC family transcriptional regulator [Enterobacter sp.]|uniref:AraC family transcriptional regulator n=1 Tax=Enterobacter sp. TaxID=42895 RepID=UPI00296EC38A|nr:AraC family transcriptional regulator [Enterobacter sp.]
MNKSNFCTDLITWIEKNITENIRLDDLAVKSGYSKWHLQRIFKSHTGIPPGLFIKAKKLEYAYRDIIMQKDTITTISIKYGFESLQSFTRAFTRHFGFPPSWLRKTH